MTSNQSQFQQTAQPLLKTMKKVPSQLIKDQETGKNIIEQFPKPQIIQFLNLGDHSIYTDSQVHVDEPIFQPIPHVIQFTNYEALQIKEQILRLRNKDKYARTVKIMPPDLKLFQVIPCKKIRGKDSKVSGVIQQPYNVDNMTSKVAPGMEISYIIRFSPEAKIDINYKLQIVTEREVFEVPIIAVGNKAMIDFPDQLDFKLVAVKHSVEKPVMIRNIGEKSTKWHLKVPNGFKVNKTEGILEVGQSEQVVFIFNPQESRPYKDELLLQYDSYEAIVPIFGDSHNDNVYLSKTHIHMEPTSITLYSHQYFQIVNKSTAPAEFSWRAFATEREENEKKTRLNLQLSQEEAEERMILEESNLEESMAESLDSDDSYDEDELNKKQERAQQKQQYLVCQIICINRAIATLARKYQSIRKAVEEDLMLFQDEIFSIEPLQGKIWPNTEITCCVTFKPQGPYHYSCTAFCNITCSEERLPLNMTGQGKGPQAQLSITEMDIGDIFVNFQNEFDVGIENTGEIDCHYKLIPYETPFGSKFQFSKVEGVLGVKEKSRDLIKVRFKSDILGEFSETFRFALEGSSEMLTLTFKGHVVAPTFKFSEEIIDFGKVSYKFPVYKTVYLTNTSDVEINYVVRVPGDGRSLQNEFNITSDKGRLEKNREAQITIEFIPWFPQQYDMVLVVDLEGVGQDMLAVPIKAECLVPKVKIQPADFLEFETCFLRHAVTKRIEIINEDTLKAKYEILPQDDQSKRIAVYTADQESAIINPKSSQVVNITLKTEILSAIRIPLYIKVEGYHIPFMVTILATSIGPIVSVNKSELDYNNVEVLKDYIEKISINNESKIPAEYTAFTKNKESIWKVIQRHGVLKPGDEKEIEVVCNADEVQKFSDTLHIIVNNGVDLEVALRAKGVGSTLYCKDNLNSVDFGTEYTHNNITKEFFLENRGRKQMKIQWVRTTKVDRKNQQKNNNKSKEEQKSSESPKKSGNNDQSLVSGAPKDETQEEIKFVFAVVPDVIVLNPKMGIPIQFRANSFNIGKIIETWACNVTVGGDRKPKTVWNTTVQGEFITPGLNFSEAKLFFKYLWEKGVASMPITKALDITNGGPLPTSINLKIDPPFSCATEKLTLAPQKTETIKIDFDPGMKQDRLSDNISGKLNISHIGHPQKDLVHLQGEVCFPNLQIQPPNIDFGTILNDTSKKKYLTLTNISEMPVTYEWSFLEEEITSLNPGQKEEEKKGKKKGKINKKSKALPINQVFDILPVSGVLHPGQTETVEFTYYSGHGLLYNGIAVCSVDGGPDYEVPIIGESSFINYTLSTKEIDYGEIPYNEQAQKEFQIENIGKVPFEFNINLNTVSRPGLVECYPMTGKVISGEKFKVIVKFFPGVPDNINEMFLVECAHFPQERFKVRAIGIYPGCLLSFPRNDDEDFQRRYEDIKKMILKGKVAYSALFQSQEAIKQMTPIPQKNAEKDKSLVKEPFVMDVEAEVDRRLLCEKILTSIDVAQAKQAMNQTQIVVGSSQILQVVSNQEKGNGSNNQTQGGSQMNKKGGKTPVQKKPQNAAQLKSSVGFGNGEGEKSIIGGPGYGIGGTVINLENITIASYICDFGNVVVGATKKKSFRLTNVGKIPVTFSFDKKILSQAGINIDPDKVQKVMPNSSILFNVVFTTRKNARFGKTKYVVPIDVKYGPSYAIEFIANLTIPELSMSTDNLDFGKVCVNTRKTVKIRFENSKEVPCDWWYYYKPDVATAATVAKEGERFQVFPQNGTLLPGQKQSIDVMFIPNSDKPFLQKLTFKCKDNPKQFLLNVKGQGVNYQVEFNPETSKMAPVLPYNNSAIVMIEMKNPMEQSIECYSVDFDKNFIEEEEVLKRLDNFTQQIPDPLFLPLRQPGSEFWPQIKKQDAKKRKIEDIKKQIKIIDDQIQLMNKDDQIVKAPEVEQVPVNAADIEKKRLLIEQKGNLEVKLIEEENDAIEIKYPMPVKEKDKLNIVLIGPEKCGKTTVANYLAQEHQRCVVKFDQLFDYCLKRGLPIAERATKYLEEKEEELKKILEEQEKKKKQKKVKKGEEEPEINQAEFKYLPKDIVIEMVQQRLKEEDCNAGVIFDNLESHYWNNIKFPIEVICDALPKQNIQLLIFQMQKEQLNNDLAEYDVCTNYRYMRRKDDQLMLQVSKKDETQAQVDGQEAKKKNVKKAPQVKGLKKNKKDEQKQEPQKTPEEEEIEKKRKEMEDKKILEEERKEMLRPKEYSKEELETYHKIIEEINNDFASIIMRQMNIDDSVNMDLQPGNIEDGANGEANLEKEDKIIYGKRIIVDQFIHYDFKYLCENSKKQVPEPLWPDPDKEPLPHPVIHQIIKKPPNRNERQPIALFSIWTPKDPLWVLNEQDPLQLPEMIKDQTRWVLGPKESRKIFVKFFSKVIGTYDQIMQFEIVGSYKQFNLNMNAICEFPTINSNYKNVFMAQKKSRPPQVPDCYLSKCFVVNENVFDFGPLLISKDPEKRHNDEIVKKVNSSVFQITNNGKYDLTGTFTLKSTLPIEEGGTGEKSPFILDPDHVELKIDETKVLTVYAFPDKAQVFKDEVICLIKDNPNPVIFPIQCQGAKPVVDVDQDIVEFDRLLLEKKMTKTLTLKNVCAIKVKWKLNVIGELPEEFQISKLNGMIDPNKEEIVDITFQAKKEQKFNQKIILEVEDTEGYNVKQENKTIELKAEAFKISLDIKMSHDQILDFDHVRVGEPKENKIFVKNIGMYPIKYGFTMKKKQTREIFTIEPMEGELNPNEEKNIVVKFMSQKEIKLKTTKNTSDIILNILEGKSQEKHTEIPINVNVNAVYSKYTITPLKNINFGPMKYEEQVTRSFEIRNDGFFDFKFAICDYKDEEAKKKIRDDRQKEIEDRIRGHEEDKEEAKGAKGKKPEPQKAAPKGKDKGKDAPPEGGLVEVTQYSITPATGVISPNNAAIINVTFKAKLSKFYESTIAIDISNRDPQDQHDGIPFELNAESSIPGINTEDLDQIFEEQTVIPSLDPAQNTQTVITSSLFAIQERVFWFGTLIASKNQEGARERFKIMNPNKINCTVKFSVKARTQSKSEGFAFDVKPDILTIEPHKHKYVTVGFFPTNMQTYGGLFEAIVDNGDSASKSGKLVFELRGEGTLPTLQIEKPKDVEADGTPALRFKKTRIGKEQIMTIVLKNEGSIAATARFDVIKNDCFNFMNNLSHTITPKTYYGFDVKFVPKAAQTEKFLLTFNTMHNPYEQHKVMIIGEGYVENVTFEGLPENLEDELLIGDCIVSKAKSATFFIVNNGEKSVRFKWNQGDKDEFKFYPMIGHLKGKASKQIKVVFKSGKTVKYEKIDLVCETMQIEQRADPETGQKYYRDWDDTMKTMRMVRPSEYRKIMKQRDDEEKKRKEEAEAAILAAQKKGAKPAGKPAGKKEDLLVEPEIVIDISEDPNVELIETLPEIEFDKVEQSDKNVILKTSLVCDYAKYETTLKNIDFKPTLMYASRSFKFTLKNTSLICLNYNFKIANSETGILDAGAYSIIPKKGSIAAGCDDNFVVKFSPVEVENDFSRILSANIEHLSPDLKPLIIEANGIAERPIIHFELPHSSYRERKEKDMTPIDQKFKIIEFESLGTNIKTTKRFMAVNPTSSGYEFEWTEINDDTNKKIKPMFKCQTPKGVILSGKKFEMVFEYTPDNVGEHESQWFFKIATEKITQDFLVVGRVNEPNVLFETGKIKFGPLLLEGKNREVVNLINQEMIPFSFNFSKESVKGNTDYGDSIRVNPMSGIVPPQGQIPLEILFQPKYELTYNYNLLCNVKRKDRPLVLNVKGEGYKIHHTVLADINKVNVQASEPYKFDYSDFFINEKKSKIVFLQNNGEFNFDFVWKRQVNKYITITPETGTVQKGSEVSFDITYLPIAEHHLKNYKVSLNIVSGPKYDFLLNGSARKPGIKLSFTNYDFGPCFVMRQPMPKKAILEITNMDNSAISIETLFEKKPYLDVQLSPGQVLLPFSQNNDKLEVPIIFTTRDIRKYSETITFDFNNLYKMDVIIAGEGIPMQLELQDPDQGSLDFGIVSVSGDVTRTIPLINRSKRPATFKLLPGNEELFKKNCITFNPDQEMTLKPKEVVGIEIRFNPKTRLQHFNLDLQLQIKDNEAKKLVEIQGVSYGIELKLMDEVLAFGSVVKGSRLTKLLQLSNFGDVKASYKWDTQAYKKYFTITPDNGYIPPNSNLDLEVTFHPTQADPDIRINKIKCEIKGGEPLFLNLIGKCVEQDGSSLQNLNFQAVVRKQAKQVINIQNTEDKEWAITPTISTEQDFCNGYFIGKQTLIINPKQQAQYEIIYNPKTMTKKISQDQIETHKGSLFFPLPNGTALLYKLNGTATEPEAEGVMQDTVSAKKSKFIIVPVKNWLKIPQRFKVSWVVEGDQDQTTFIRGANTIDVAGDSQKDYKLSFLAYKIGVYKFIITFKNEQSGEYLFYKMQIQATEAEIIEKIELVSPIRESISKTLTFENPTDNEITILKTQFIFQNEYIDIIPDVIKIPGKSERGFEINYRPLIVSEQEIDFVLKNPQLGDFKYRLALKGIAPNTQRSMAFKCALGADLVQAFKFTHYLKKQTNYVVKIERLDQPGMQSDFKSEQVQVAAPIADSSKGVEVSVNIRYEPFTISDSRAILKLNSPEGMEYTCLLFGKSTAPQPQGPIKCVPGAKPIGIDFKNPLNEKCEFQVTFDNPNFSLGSKLPGPLDPGKNTNLQIKYDAKAEYPNTGRMIVSTKGLPPWIYYLQGD